MATEHVRRAMSNQVAHLHGEEQVIVLQGPRAVGKTTLLRAFHDQVGGSFVDLADDTALGVARLDPAGYLDGLASPVLTDEFQRLPELVAVVKRTVDLSTPVRAVRVDRIRDLFDHASRL